MSDIKFSIINLEKAISRLEEAVNEPQVNDFVIDATIQRFEFVIELFWKTLKRLMYIEGIESSTPKDTLIKARENKWLSDSDIWVQMLRDRNETSHVYNETKAREIYQHVHDYFPELKRVFLALKEKFSKD
jgi:nucleotidyltransferase substrate binding protein (TIGR01987 family)